MNKEKDNSTFLHGAIWLVFSTLILKIIGLVYKIPLSYLLGDEGMGYFNSAYTLYTFFYIIGSAGIPKAISIITSKHEAESSESTYNIFISSFKILFIFAISLTVVFLLLVRPITVILDSKNCFYPMIAVAPSILFVTSSGVLRGFFAGKMKFAPIAVSELIASFSKLIIGFLFAFISVRQGFNLSITCAGAILGITLGSFFGMIYLWFQYTKNTVHVKKKTRTELKYIKEIVRHAAPLTFAAALGSIVNILDLTLITRSLKSNNYADSVATILYGNYTTLAVPMFGMITTLLAPFTTSAQPLLTKNYSKGAFSEFYSTLSKCSEICYFISIPCFIAFLFFPEDILTIIFERESAILGAPMLAAISPSLLFYASLIVMNTSFEATGNTKQTMVSLSLGAAFKLIIVSIFINTEKIGILAAPLGTAVSYITSFFISYLMFKNKFKSKTKNIVPFFKYLLISISCAFLVVFIKHGFDFQIHERLKSLLFLIIFSVIYLLISVFSSKNIKSAAFSLFNTHKTQ